MGPDKNPGHYPDHGFVGATFRGRPIILAKISKGHPGKAVFVT